MALQNNLSDRELLTYIGLSFAHINELIKNQLSNSANNYNQNNGIFYVDSATGIPVTTTNCAPNVATQIQTSAPTMLATPKPSDGKNSSRKMSKTNNNPFNMPSLWILLTDYVNSWK